MTLEEFLASAVSDAVNARWRSYADGIRSDVEAVGQGRSHYAQECQECGRTSRRIVKGRCPGCNE